MAEQHYGEVSITAKQHYLVWTDADGKKQKEPIADTTELLTAIKILGDQGISYTVEE